jgi:integrase
MADAPKMVRTKTPGVYKQGKRYVSVFRDGEGRQRKERFRTYDQARRSKHDRESQVADGTYAPSRKTTFKDYASEWIEGYAGKRQEVRARTKADYRRHLESYAFKYFKERKLSSISPRDIDNFVAWLRSEEKQERKLTSKTIERILVPLRLCLESAYRHGEISNNPVLGVVIPKPKKIQEDDDLVKAMTLEQLGRFLACVPEDWRLFFETLAATGARWSEATAWRVRDLDEGASCLKVRRSLSRLGEAQPPKTEQSRRDIPVSQKLLAKLKAEVSGRSPEALIFGASNGSPLRAENVRRRQLEPAAEEAGVPWAGFHTFRHTAASLLFAGGANIVEVQKFLGHHSAAFTLDTYIHLVEGKSGSVFDLDELLKSVGESQD